jgi:hypothetical protein
MPDLDSRVATSRCGRDVGDCAISFAEPIAGAVFEGRHPAAIQLGSSVEKIQDFRPV